MHSSFVPVAPSWGSKTGGYYRERGTIGMAFSLFHYMWGSKTESDCRERAKVEGLIVERLLLQYRIEIANATS